MLAKPFFILLMTLASSLVQATDTPADRNAVIGELMEVSGLNHQIEQIPPMLDAGMRQGRNGIDADSFTKVSDALSEFNTSKVFREEIKNSLDKNYDAERFAAFLAMARSPLAQKMIRLENEASTPEALANVREYAATLQKNPPASRRMELIERLDKATGATTVNLNIQLWTFQAMASIMDPVLPPERRMKPEQLEDIMWQIQLQSRPMIQQFAQINMLYAYRSVSDHELTEYLKLYETEIGKWYVDLAGKAIVSAFSNIAEKTAQRLKKALPPPARGGS